MHPRTAEFAAQARERYGLDPEIEEFSEGTKTAAAAAEAVGCDVEQIASSLVFDVDGDAVVAITSGANRVSEDRLAAQFDADGATMTDTDRVRAETGWTIGGVPPICHERDLPTVMDPTLLDYDAVWAAAGTPDAVFRIDPERLRRLAGATVADVTEP